MFERVCTIGIPFAESAGRSLKLDLYRPDLPPGSPPPPIVVYLHGGGWLQGTRSGPSGVAFALELSAEGLAVASADYRLGPDHPAPAAIEDCKLAVRFVRTRAAEWGIDGSRIVAMGNSAGGHLAAMLGLTRPEDGLEGPGLEGVSSAVSAVIDLCGIADVGGLLRDPQRRDWAAAWLGGSDERAAELAERCSPLTYAGRCSPPFLMVHGARDTSVPVEQAEALAAALTRAGNDCTFLRLAEAGHQLGVPASVEVQQRLRAERRRFLERLGLKRAEV